MTHRECYLTAAREIGMEENLIMTVMKKADDYFITGRMDKQVEPRPGRTDRTYIEEIKESLQRVKAMSPDEHQSAQARLEMLLASRLAKN